MTRDPVARRLWRAFIPSHARLLLVLAAAALAVATLQREAWACTCVPPGSPGDELERSTAVLTGKVTRMETISADIVSTADPVRVTFQVYCLGKGPKTEALTINTARSTVSCGYEFEAGREYLVYAYREAADLQVSLCSRTRPLTLTAVDLIALGRGRDQAGGVLQTYKYLTMVAVVTAAGTAVGVKWLLAQREALRSRPCSLCGGIKRGEDENDVHVHCIPRMLADLRLSYARPPARASGD